MSADGPWMQTFTRRKFRFEATDMEMLAQIDIRDIAEAACIRRFGGHSKRYLVAEHCVRVAWLLPPAYRLLGLLHDAGEAYTGDWIYPLKGYYKDTAIEAVANRIQNAIYAKYGVAHLMESQDVRRQIKAADLRMLAVEARDVVPGGAIEEWDRKTLPSLPPLMQIRKPWKGKVARARYLDHFFAYTEGSYEERYLNGREL